MDKRWKAVERAVARILGTQRIPLLGRQGCDLENDFLFVEVKSRQNIAPYLWEEFLAQILEGAEKCRTSKVPAIVLHRPGMRYRDALLCIRLGDYPRLLHLIAQSIKSQISQTKM